MMTPPAATRITQPATNAEVASGITAHAAAATRDREAERSRHAGHWVVLDARFHLLAIGQTLYQGTSARSSLDATARRVLLPAMRASYVDRRPRADTLRDLGRGWVIGVHPIFGPVSGHPVAMLGCYGPAGSPLPEPPLIGSWEWHVTPPGIGQRMRLYWTRDTFAVYDIPAPAGDGPFWWETPQWLDEIVVDPHRTNVRRVLETFLTATSDTLLTHAFAARSPATGQVHHVRLAGSRDVTAPGPDIWLRGVTIRLAHASGIGPSEDSPSYFDAAFALACDPLCAIDTVYEHLYLTSGRFTDLGVALPAHRHLPEMCHPDDLPALRAMLKQAITCTSTLTAPVRVRLKAASGGWRPVEMVGSGVRLGDEAPHHVLCRVLAQPDI